MHPQPEGCAQPRKPLPMPSVLDPHKTRIPTLRRHCRGSFYVRIPHGGSLWFGSDQASAERAYSTWAEGFAAENHPRKGGGNSKATLSARSPRGMDPASAPAVPTLSTQAVAEQLFALVDSESGPAGRRKVRACLKRFLEHFGTREIGSLKAADLIAYKAKLVGDGLKPTTINDALTYARRLLTFAYDAEYVQVPFRLRVLKNVPKGAVKSKAVSVANLKTLLKAAHDLKPNVARMMLLQFWGVMRPSELPKVLYRQGEERGTGVFAIDGKTTRKTGELRPVLLTDAALKLMEQTEPLYKDGLGYRHEVWKLGRRLRREHGDGFIRALVGTPDLSPHFLRHTANQALIDAGVREEYIRTAMGRLKARVDRGYGAKENYEEARKAVGVLAKLVPLLR